MAPLMDLLGKVVLTHASLEAYDIVKLRLVSGPCVVLPQVSSDATFTVATNASSLEIAAVMLQDQEGKYKPISY
jgi:hypothetical protein